MLVFDRQLLSTVLGYLSIVSWLGAQLPQLFANFRNSSVEGLALPFLVSWAIGDATNLLGCLLTHQLAFQTTLATYFVLVDIGLMSQFIHYTRKNPARTIPPLAAHRTSARPARRVDTWPRESSKSAWKADKLRSVSTKRKRALTAREVNAIRGSSRGREDLEASWMTEASARTAGRQPSRPQTLPSTSRNISSASSTHQLSRPQSLHRQAMSIPTSPVDHFPERGRPLTRPIPVPTHQFAPLEPISGSPSSHQSPLSAQFNQFEDRVVDQQDVVAALSGAPMARNTSSRSKSKSTRRSSSMVFFSIGLLVTFGKWSGAVKARSETGRAWEASRTTISPIVSPVVWESYNHPVPIYSSALPAILRLERRQANLTTSWPINRADEPDDDEDEPVDWERVLGRASAWVCTTLYLTSRMPQIWKNYRRRSVEGLSMLLFIMAFVGNSFYVLSILTNPLARIPGYLLESTPYLLGSGGTLCFDFAIVVQSFLYSPKRREAQAMDRRRRGKGKLDLEEAAALLHEREEEYDTEGSTTTGPNSRSASRSVSLAGRSRSTRRPLEHYESRAASKPPSKAPSLIAVEEGQEMGRAS